MLKEINALCSRKKITLDIIPRYKEIKNVKMTHKTTSRHIKRFEGGEYFITTTRYLVEYADGEIKTETNETLGFAIGVCRKYGLPVCEIPKD